MAVSNAVAPDAGRAARPLPDRPLVSIRPSRGWSAPDVRELWAYRELLYYLTWRDITVRYKQTALGVAWAVIQPLGTMLIFTLFFGRLAGMASDGIPYPLFALAGLVPWTFFSTAVTVGGNSLVNSAHLITKVYFPRMLVPCAAVAAGLVDLALGFVLLALFVAWYGVAPTWGLALLPALVALMTALAVAVGMLLAALNVRYRDVRHALPFLVQIWMFATPIIYPLSLVPPRWRWIQSLNPMTGIIENLRRAIVGGPGLDGNSLSISAGVTLVLLVVSSFAFRRMESSFTDVV